MVVLWMIAVASAYEVKCEDVSEMVSIGVPSESIRSYVGTYTSRDDNPTCLDALPLDVRAHMLDLPITAPAPEPQPQEPMPQPPLEPVTTRFVALPPDPKWVPNDTTAVLLSTVVGFGAGHAYAGQTEAATGHALAQATGLSVAILGANLAGTAHAASLDPTLNSEEWQTQMTLGLALAGLGGVVFHVDRMIDIASAPGSVRRTLDGH